MRFLDVEEGEAHNYNPSDPCIAAEGGNAEHCEEADDATEE